MPLCSLSPFSFRSHHITPAFRVTSITLLDITSVHIRPRTLSHHNTYLSNQPTMTLASMYKLDYIQMCDQHAQTNLNSSWVNDKGTLTYRYPSIHSFKRTLSPFTVLYSAAVLYNELPPGRNVLAGRNATFLFIHDDLGAACQPVLLLVGWLVYWLRGHIRPDIVFHSSTSHHTTPHLFIDGPIVRNILFRRLTYNPIRRLEP